MSEQKMREALQDCVNGLDDVMLELGFDALLPEFFRACEALRKGREALAQQPNHFPDAGNMAPAAVVELTDEEILTARMDWAMENDPQALSVDEWKVGASRAVIAAHIAKQSGGAA